MLYDSLLYKECSKNELGFIKLTFFKDDLIARFKILDYNINLIYGIIFLNTFFSMQWRFVYDLHVVAVVNYHYYPIRIKLIKLI